MFIKRKNIVVTFFSAAIIAVVLVSTLAAYSLYIQWKKDSFSSKYRASIYKITSDLFKNDVMITSIRVNRKQVENQPDRAIVDGVIKNSSTKTVTSIRLEVSFASGEGRVFYKEWFYPLEGVGDFADISILPGESFSFQHVLKNCPQRLVETLGGMDNFAKNSDTKPMNINCSITGLNMT